MDTVQDHVTTTKASAPVSYWIIAVLSLLWNGFGTFDYTMTSTRNADYLKNFPPEMMTVIDEFPAWVTAAWACGVWGALAGSILLLLRSRFAIHAFGVSLAGLAASTAYQWTIDMPESLKSGAQTAMQVVIWIAAIGLLWFAVTKRRDGILS
jgi:hypothetical protein